MTSDSPIFTVIHNSLKPRWTQWFDEGDYPSGAGSCPRRPSWFIEDFTGSLVVECSDPLLALGDPEWQDFLLDLNAAPDATVTLWSMVSVIFTSDRVKIEWVPQEWEERERERDVD